VEVQERLEIEPREVEWEESLPVKPKTVVPEQQAVKPVELPQEEAVPVPPEPVAPEEPTVKPVEPPKEEAVPVQPRAVPVAKPSAVPVPPRPESVPIQPRTVIPQKPPIAPPPVPPRPAEPVAAQAKQQEDAEQPTQAEKESFDDVLIGQQPIKLTIPAHVIRNAQAADPETKNKLAGYWAAQILKGNPQLAHTSADPVSLWFDVKNVILKKFNSR
jgi:hypothetical protein